MGQIQFKDGKILFVGGAIALDPDCCCDEETDCITCRRCFHEACDPCREMDYVTVEITGVDDPTDRNDDPYDTCSPPYIDCGCDSILNGVYTLDLENTCSFVSDVADVPECGENKNVGGGFCAANEAYKVRLAIEMRYTATPITITQGATGVTTRPACNTYTVHGHYLIISVEFLNTLDRAHMYSFYYYYSYDNIEDDKAKCSLMSSGQAVLIGFNDHENNFFQCWNAASTLSYYTNLQYIICNLNNIVINCSAPVFLPPDPGCSDEVGL